MREILCSWIEAIATVLMESMMEQDLAWQQGEDGVITIQDALILLQGLNNLALFQRVIKQLPQEL